MKCIYVRTNLVNGKQYVGQTNDFKQREKDWKTVSLYAGDLINKARKKYGLENWKVDILRECETQEELNKWEMYYIKSLNTKKPNGYNLTDGGGGLSGLIFTDEHKRKLSESRKGKSLSKETRRKISEANIGKRGYWKDKTFSEEHKRKLSENSSRYFLGKHHTEKSKSIMSQKAVGNKRCLGRILSEETKNKISEAEKGKVITDETKVKMSLAHGGGTVYQYTLDGILVNTFSTASEAAKKLSIDLSCICDCCRGKLQTYKGYKWSRKPL